MWRCKKKKSDREIKKKKKQDDSFQNVFFSPNNHPATSQNYLLNLTRVFSSDVFLCGTLLSYTYPPLCFPPRGGAWKENVSNIVKTPTTHASSIQSLLQFHTQREEEWSDEKQGEERFDFCISIWGVFFFSSAGSGMRDLHLICILRLCVSAERRHDVRGLLSSCGGKKTDLITRRHWDYNAVLSHLCFLSFEDFPQMITIVLHCYLMIILITSGLRWLL